MAGYPHKYEGEQLAALEQSLREVMDDEKRDRLTGYLNTIANHYGIVPVRMAYDIMTRTLGEEISESDFERYILWQRHTWEGFFWIVSDEEVNGYEDEPESDEALFDKDVIGEVYIEDLNLYDELRGFQADKPYNTLSREELLRYEELVEYPDNEYTGQTVKIFKEKLNISDEGFGIKPFVDDIITGIRLYSSFERVLQDIRFYYELSTETAKEMLPVIADLINHLSLPMNRGYTPIEMEKLKAESGASWETFFIDPETYFFDEERDREVCRGSAKKSRGELEDISRLFSDLDTKQELRKNPKGAFAANLFESEKQMPIRVEKIGRNEPCPCGSGKKYKKCCGKGK